MLKKLLTILLAAVPLLGFSIDYHIATEIYNSGDYTVEAIAISNSEEFFNTDGAHQTYISQIRRECSTVATSFPSGNEVLILDEQEFSIEKNRYLTKINYLNGHFGYVINIKNSSTNEIIASGYILKSEVSSPYDTDNWNNIIMMSDGLDYLNKRDFFDIMAYTSFNKLVQPNDILEGSVYHKTPLSSGYDICFVDFSDGAGDIRKNAKAYLKLIEYISTKTNSFSVGGFSMGGIISRLALLYGEKQQISAIRKINKFISIDSPQNGANIMPDLQDVIQEFSSEKKSEWAEITQIAPQQMLYYHTLYDDGREHDKFYAFLNNMGHFPSVMKRYSIASSPWLEPYPNKLGTHAAQFEINIPFKDPAKRQVHLQARDLAAGSSIDLLKPTTELSLLWGALTFYRQTNYDNTGTPDKITPTDEEDYYFRPTFIPVESVYAIKINTPESFRNPHSLERLAASGYTPFDKILATSQRDEHIKFSAELISLIMQCLNDEDSTSKEQKQVLMLATGMM